MSKFQERLVIFGFPVVDLGGVSRKTMENQNFNLTCCLHKESLIAGEFIPVHGSRDGTYDVKNVRRHRVFLIVESVISFYMYRRR